MMFNFGQNGIPLTKTKLLSSQIADDEIEQSSQWDGFRHYSQPRDPKGSSNTPDRVFYGGTTKEEIMDTSNHRIGLQHWASEGIAGESCSAFS